MDYAGPLTRLGDLGNETVSEFLVRRERELVQQTAAIRGMIHNLLGPKEHELAEVRKAMAALNLHHGNPLADVMAGSEVTPYANMSLGNALAGNAQTSSPASTPLGESGTLSAAFHEALFSADGLTIKQMIVFALRDHFHEGATPTELRDYMKAAYNRDIDRNSISPQLARLRDEGRVKQTGNILSGKWTLTGLGAIELADGLPQDEHTKPDH